MQYLQVLFPVKDDWLGLHFTILDVHFVAAEHNGDVLAHPHQVAMPVGNVFVGDTRSDIKHDDGALALKEIIMSN